MSNSSNSTNGQSNQETEFTLDQEFSPLSISPDSYSGASGAQQAGEMNRNPLPPLDSSFLSSRPDRPGALFGFPGPSTSGSQPVLFTDTPPGFIAMDSPFRNRSTLQRTQETKTKLATPAKNEPPEPFELPTKTQMKIKIRRFVGVAEWKWIRKSTDDSCGICLQVFEACCVDCKVPGEKCPLVEGSCTHSFHAHCIDRWIRSQQTEAQRDNVGVIRKQCPLCRQDWVAKKDLSGRAGAR
ncbi:hypothetical protein QR680_001310 [Steinernema hermaphroditum]|uniref:Anaphase-promoting complex subunit 11 n=1 Tax=Steinernema hermaphroditum TaxID=289476 RepID=A0AA39GZN4_9BILA|nr:hypothetical protein QR680_001310 [Steinernema hermaphroditum]